MSAGPTEGGGRVAWGTVCDNQAHAGAASPVKANEGNSTSEMMACAADTNTPAVTQKVDDLVSGKYQLLQCLGHGTFGVVYSAKCLDPSGPQGPLAIKLALPNRDKSKNEVNKNYLQISNDSLRREKQYLELLHDGSKASDVFIKLLDAYTDTRANQYCLVMPQMACTIYKAIQQTMQRLPYAWENRAYPLLKIDPKSLYEGFSFKKVKMIARQLLSAAEDMRGKRVVHGDIKPENILMMNADGTRVKICDFGAADTINCLSSVLRQTLYYRAPEATTSKKATYSLDMWGIGCILVEALIGGDLIHTKYDPKVPPDVENARHLLNIASLVGHYHHFTHIDSPVKMLLYDYDCKKEKWKVKAGAMEALFDQSARTWADILSREVLEQKQAQFYSQNKRVAVVKEFEGFFNFITKVLHPDPRERYTPSDALQDPWICYKEGEDSL